MEMKDKVVVVTGGASGMGRACVTLLLEQGAKVVATDRLADELAELPTGPRLRTVEGDLADGAVPDRVIDETVEAFGTVDGVIGAAGMTVWGPTDQLADDGWDLTMAVNVTANFRLARAAGRVMLPKRSGALVFISSMCGLQAVPDNAAYVTTKHALVGLTRSLAVDWARHGIRVNALCPGFTMTRMIKEQIRPDALAERVQRIPLGRAAEPEEQAELAVFLISDRASYTTGLIATNDGGQGTLYSGWAASGIGKND